MANRVFIFSRTKKRIDRKGLFRRIVVHDFGRKVRIVLLLLRFCTNVFLYGLVINITSTKGYFLSQEEKKTNQASFRFTVVRFSTVGLEKILRDTLNTTTTVEKKEILR